MFTRFFVFAAAKKNGEKIVPATGVGPVAPKKHEKGHRYQCPNRSRVNCLFIKRLIIF